MDDEALKALLEQQERSRDKLQKQLDADRDERAKVRAAAKPGLKFEPPGTPKQQVSPETVKVEIHNLGIEDRQAMSRSKQADLDELAEKRLSPQGHKFNEQARDQSKPVRPPEAERTPPEPINQRPNPLTREFNKHAQDAHKPASPTGPQKTPAELARQAELERFREDALKRFQLQQKKGLGHGLRPSGSTGTDE